MNKKGSGTPEQIRQQISNLEKQAAFIKGVGLWGKKQETQMKNINSKISKLKIQLQNEE